MQGGTELSKSFFYPTLNMDPANNKITHSNGNRLAEAFQRRWKKQLEEKEHAKYTKEIQENLAEEAQDEADGKRKRGCSACRENGRLLLDSNYVLRANVFLCIIDCIMVMVELMLDNAAVRDDIVAKYGRRWENCDEQNSTSHSGERFRRSSDSSATGEEYGVHSPYANIAHYCHYISEAILILLTIETLIRLFCFGKRFFRSKLEVFDAFIVISSLVADSILLDGVTNNPPLISSTVVNLLLPWRIIRVVNSLIIATRDHEHFKLLLVYKAKRLVEDDLYITSRKLQLSEDRIDKLLETIRRCDLNTDEVEGKGECDEDVTKTPPASEQSVVVSMPTDEVPSYEECTSPMPVTHL